MLNDFDVLLLWTKVESSKLTDKNHLLSNMKNNILSSNYSVKNWGLIRLEYVCNITFKKIGETKTMVGDK